MNVYSPAKSRRTTYQNFYQRRDKSYVTGKEWQKACSFLQQSGERFQAIALKFDEMTYDADQDQAIIRIGTGPAAEILSLWLVKKNFHIEPELSILIPKDRDIIAAPTDDLTQAYYTQPLSPNGKKPEVACVRVIHRKLFQHLYLKIL